MGDQEVADGSAAAVRSVCVFCGSSYGIAAEYATAATMLVSSLVNHGYRVVYGGGRTGLMGIVADTALALGGTVVGVISEHLLALEVGHPDLTALEVTHDINERKRRMAELADAFVALPGGLGTLEEITEVMSRAQLGLHNKPCALLNVNDYFEHLIEFVNHAVGSGFAGDAARDLLIVESEPEQLLARLSARLGAPPGA